MSYIAIEQNETSFHEVYPLSPREIRPLLEIAQDGAAGSTNSLRDFLGIYNEVRVNCLSFLPVPILMERIQLYYQNHLGFQFRFSGEIHGAVFALIHEEQATKFVARSMGPNSNVRRYPDHRKLNHPEISLLTEWINIIANSFRQALTEKTHFNWWITSPQTVNNVRHSIAYAAKVFNLDHYAIHLEYLIPLLELRTQLFILPDANMLAALLTRLGQLERNGSPVSH